MPLRPVSGYGINTRPTRTGSKNDEICVVNPASLGRLGYSWQTGIADAGRIAPRLI